MEDIVDTGRTISYLRRNLDDPPSPEPRGLRAPRQDRAAGEVDVDLDYVGFVIPDEFVVGYGSTTTAGYRNCPIMAVLEPDSPPDPRSAPPRDPSRRMV